MKVVLWTALENGAALHRHRYLNPLLQGMSVETAALMAHAAARAARRARVVARVAPMARDQSLNLQKVKQDALALRHLRIPSVDENSARRTDAESLDAARRPDRLRHQRTAHLVAVLNHLRAKAVAVAAADCVRIQMIHLHGGIRGRGDRVHRCRLHSHLHRNHGWNFLDRRGDSRIDHSRHAGGIVHHHRRIRLDHHDLCLAPSLAEGPFGSSLPH